MNVARVGVFAIALLVAGVMVFFGRHWLGFAAQQPQTVAAPSGPAQRLAKPSLTEAPQPAPALQVLVARTDIRTGQIVKPDDMRWQAWPDGTISPTYIIEGRRPLSDFVGAVARAPISAGEPITEGRVVLSGTRGFMAAVLQPGMRAVSVQVTPTSGVSGFIFAGDRVDLILTHTYEKDSLKERQASETILRDIRVIAMDQRLDVRPGEAPQIAKTATLEVTPKQAEIIVLLAEMGKLSLALRSLQEPSDVDGGAAARTQDNEPSFTRDSNVSRLLGGPAAPVAASTGGGGAPATTITILRGTAATTAAPQTGPPPAAAGASGGVQRQ
ncbi:MAG: Flp pilus assembly protein CpaB [Alphaproteobacteria bacterium]|nr:Flp pilus assembly protein CpaB [Alphaproteobacteria bacterium]MCW5744177.1 Flp pilus assembly protein CpaB [Alphaproteobacteria bacterium]